MNKKFDLICMGRSGVDLYGNQLGSRLQDVSSFNKYVGGSPCNIAIGASKLGLRVGMITGVGAEQFGDYLVENLRHYGVDTTFVKKDSQRLTALAILSIQNQETFPLLFYRTDCPDMALEKSDINTEYIKQSQALLITGTSLSAEPIRSTCFYAAQIASENGVKVIFDIDYRPVLWGVTHISDGESRFVRNKRISESLQAFVPYCDLIVGTEEEFAILSDGLPHEQLPALLFPKMLRTPLLVLKTGEKGCSISTFQETRFMQSGQRFRVNVLNVLGAGDAFMSGFLRGWLRDKPLNECATLGNACGALVVSRHGCSPASPNLDELEYFLSNYEQLSEVPDQDQKFENIHRSGSELHSPNKKEFCIFAFDHRAQLQKMIKDICPQEPIREKIIAIKNIFFEIFQETAYRHQNEENTGYGFLCDTRYGQQILNAGALKKWWIARPVEKPYTTPLEFDFKQDISCELASWPTHHIVKCLIFADTIHDDPAILQQQMRQLERLYDLCKYHRLSLLVELTLTDMQQRETDSITRLMSRIYQHQVYPQWWKLPCPIDDEEWNENTKAILKHDRYCQGIVLLGLNAPLETLQKGFEIAKGKRLARGFAVGRTIFSTPCKQWLKGEINDDKMRQQVSSNFEQIISAWKT